MTKPTAKALIVDDSATMRGTLKAFLAAAGIEVVGQLSNGSQLLQTITQSTPDIVCLDYNLPDINGVELLKSIASVHPQVAVVIITGEQDPNLRNAAAQAGAAGFIRKPFSEDQIVKEIRHILYTQRLLAAAGRTPANSDEIAEFTVKKTAIIADDSKTMRGLLTAILSNQNIDVLAEAINGAQAVELVERHRPDIACLDIDMPAMNGLEALREIRQKYPATKVLMITGNTRREVVMDAVKQGAAGFVAKPFDPARVSEALAKALGA
jgi:two-component system chemotaxis response regulator CheY